MNTVILTGRIASDLDIRYTQSQMGVLKFPLAVQGKDRTDFPRITVFGKQAENTANYCHKGSQIGVVGRVQTGKYEKDGNTVYTQDIIADRVEFLSFKETTPDETDTPVEFSQIEADLPF